MFSTSVHLKKKFYIHNILFQTYYHINHLLCLSFAFALVPSPRYHCSSDYSSRCLHFAFLVNPSSCFGHCSSRDRIFLLACSTTGLLLICRHHSQCASHLRRGLCGWKLILIQDSGQVLLTPCFSPGYSFCHNTVGLLLLAQDLYSSDRGRLTRGLSDADGLGWSSGGSGGACS